MTTLVTTGKPRLPHRANEPEPIRRAIAPPDRVALQIAFIRVGIRAV